MISVSSKEKLILGTVQFGLNYGISNSKGQVTKSEVFKILKTAQDAGVQCLDTAAAYGDSEQRIGEYYTKSKQEFKVITKFHTQSNLNVAEQINNALTRLNKTSLEVVLYHSFKDYRQYLQDLEVLVQLKREGKIGKIGVSVYSNEEIDFLLNDDSIEVIQLPFNLLDNDTQRGDVLKKAKGRGKVIHIRSVFLQGLFFKDLNELPEALYPLKNYLTELMRIASDAKLTIAELALNYTLAQTYIDGVLIGVDSEDQLIENLRALKKPLSEQIIQQINALRVTDTDLLNPVNWKS